MKKALIGGIGGQTPKLVFFLQNKIFCPPPLVYLGRNFTTHDEKIPPPPNNGIFPDEKILDTPPFRDNAILMTNKTANNCFEYLWPPSILSV